MGATRKRRNPHKNNRKGIIKKFLTLRTIRFVGFMPELKVLVMIGLGIIALKGWSLLLILGMLLLGL